MFTWLWSTTRLGDPSCFGVITIRLSHSTGWLTGTFSNTPRRTSLSSPAFTSAAQWCGTGVGEVTATGVACGSTNNLRGGASVISGRGCCSQQLKAELLYLSSMYFFSIGRFSSVGSHGRTGSSVGGRDRFGHWQGLSLGPTTPELVHFGRLERLDTFACVLLLNCPILGNSSEISPNARQASSDK